MTRVSLPSDKPDAAYFSSFQTIASVKQSTLHICRSTGSATEGKTRT